MHSNIVNYYNEKILDYIVIADIDIIHEHTRFFTNTLRQETRRVYAKYYPTLGITGSLWYYADTHEEADGLTISLLRQRQETRKLYESTATKK